MPIAMYADQTNTIVMRDGRGIYQCCHLADLLHTESAEVLATYGNDFYQGMPVITRNTFGNGYAYYIASDPDDWFLDDFYDIILQQHHVVPVFAAPPRVEVTVRYKNERAILFVLNHNPAPISFAIGTRVFRDLITLEEKHDDLSLEGYGVRILIESDEVNR